MPKRGQFKKNAKKDSVRQRGKNRRLQDDRVARNKNRRQAEKAGVVKKGTAKKKSNTELHHVDGNPKNNKKSNIKPISRSRNRRLG